MKSTVIVNVGEIFWYQVDFLMDSSQQLKQLVSADIPSLSKYYREMTAQQGAGVLVVNYYPTGSVAQMEARFLKSSQIPRLSRQMGLPSLEIEFEQYDRQKQMVLAIVTAETKGAVAIELQLPTSEVSQPEAPPIRGRSGASKAKSKSSNTTTQKRSDSAKTTTQRQAKNKPNATATSKPKAAPKQTSKPSALPSAQQEATLLPTVEPDTTAKSASKGKTTAKTSKPAARGKTAARATTKQKSQPEVSPETSLPIPEERSPEPEPTPQPSAKRKTSTTASARRKSTSGAATKRRTTTPRARGKKLEW